MLLLPIFVMLVGAGVTGGFLYALLRNRRFHKVAERAVGEVTGRVRRAAESGERGRSFTITVAFRTAGNRHVRTDIHMGDTGVPKVGRQVRLLYDPQDPEIAQLDTAVGRGTCWMVPGMLFGLAFFVGGAQAVVRALLG